MIEEVVIKDSTLFKNVTLQCSSGLNVISGASGAGKSVFFHSLLALFGLKDCNASLLEAFLQGEIELEEYLSEEEISIQIIKKDKTRYFINHQSTSKKRLAEIFSPYIKTLTHKNSNELESDFLLSLLDQSIQDQEHQDNLLYFRERFLQLKEIQRQFFQLQDEEKNLIELREFAQFEIEKIESVNPKIGEYEELLELKKMFSKKEKLCLLAQEALGALEHMSKIDAFLEATGGKIEGYNEMMIEVDALIQSEMDRLNDLQEVDPEAMLDRISKLSSLITRYGSIQEAIQRLEEQKSKLRDYETSKDRLNELQEKIAMLEKDLAILATKISKKRQDSLKGLKDKIKPYCSSLLLDQVDFKMKSVAISRNGQDFLEIMLRDSNPQTLSSGEYNRLRLAILAIQEKKNAGVLLLDEIDANLSGEESEGVAKVLKHLSSSYQIFAISHQPHLPSLADKHYLVQKSENTSIIQELDTQGRILEVARMISGSNLTQEALDFARKKVQSS